MPVWGPLKPTQRTEVPAKVNTARAPAVTDTAAVAPLHAWVVSPWVQPAVKLVAGAVSSTRVPVAGGGDARRHIERIHDHREVHGIGILQTRRFDGQRMTARGQVRGA